jgi:dienelactone hydrolase
VFLAPSLSWVRRLGLCCVWLALAFVPGCTSHSRVSPWWASASLRPGRYEVGLDVQVLADGTRGRGENQPRLLQVVTWYPAVGSSRSPMTYADYERLAAAETLRVATSDFGNDLVEGYRAFLVAHGVADSVVTAWFDAPMSAVRDARPSTGRYPIVLVAQGNGQSAADQSVLGEFLASHGFVVATCPSQSRLTGQPASESMVAAAAEDQAADLALMRASAEQRRDAAAGGIAIVAHSFGARSALYEAMRDSTVRGIVSLDGGIGTATARDVYEQAASFRPSAVRIPILHFYETLDPPMTPDWATLRRLGSAQVWLAKTHDMHHHHFSVLGAASGQYPQLGQATGGTPQTGGAYAAVLAWTLAFLNAIPHVDSATFTQPVPGAASMRPEHLSP